MWRRAAAFRRSLGALAVLASTAVAGCDGNPRELPGTPQPHGPGRGRPEVRFDAPSGVQMRAGSTLRVKVQAVDGKGAPVPLHASGLPTQARYDVHTATLTFRPDYAQVGEHRFTFAPATGAGEHTLTVLVRPLSWVALTKGLTLPSESGTVVVDADARQLLHFASGGAVWARGLGTAAPTWTPLVAAGAEAVEPSAVLLDPRGRRALVLDDTAEATYVFHLEGRRWQRLAGELPEPRRRFATAIDPDNGRAFLFGGVDERGPRNDLHQLDLDRGTWTPISPIGAAPLRRAGAFAAYDAPRQRIVVVGGDAGFGGDPVRLRDAWAVALQGHRPAWVELHPAGPPPPARSDFVAIHDVVNERLLVWGGVADAKSAMDEPWELMLGVAGREAFADAWRRVVVADEPPEAQSSRLGYDRSDSGRVVMLSRDFDASPTGPHDLWELDL